MLKLLLVSIECEIQKKIFYFLFCTLFKFEKTAKKYIYGHQKKNHIFDSMLTMVNSEKKISYRKQKSKRSKK